jgi:DNA-binding MarR family transcriptional regulator
MENIAEPIAGVPAQSARVLEYLYECVRENVLPPTLREIQDSLKLSSPSVVQYYVAVLERGGYLIRRPGLARGLALTPKARAAMGESEAPDWEGAKSVSRSLIIRRLEGVFPLGKDELCDICGKEGKADGDRFCSQCRTWLMRFAQMTNVEDAVKDMARCLAMMLRYGERPEEARFTRPNSGTPQPP